MGNVFIFSYIKAVSHVFIILNVSLLAAGFCICVGSMNARRKKMYIRSGAGEVFSKNGLTWRNLIPCTDYIFFWIFLLLALIGSSLFGMTTVVALVTPSNYIAAVSDFLVCWGINLLMHQVHWKFSKKQLFHVPSICCASQTCNYMGGMWKVQIIGPTIPGKTISKILLHWGWIFLKLLLLWLLLFRKSFFFLKSQI